MKTTLTNLTNQDRDQVEFGHLDTIGREIGVQVTTFECDFVELPEDATSYYRVEPGHYFGVVVQSTRNGKKFGAGQMNVYFKTADERAAYIARRLDEGQKSAQKKGKTK